MLTIKKGKQAFSLTRALTLLCSIGTPLPQIRKRIVELLFVFTNHFSWLFFFLSKTSSYCGHPVINPTNHPFAWKKVGFPLIIPKQILTVQNDCWTLCWGSRCCSSRGSSAWTQRPFWEWSESMVNLDFSHLVKGLLPIPWSTLSATSALSTPSIKEPSRLIRSTLFADIPGQIKSSCCLSSGSTKSTYSALCPGLAYWVNSGWQDSRAVPQELKPRLQLPA